MSIGSDYSNFSGNNSGEGKKRNVENTYYSRLRFKNEESNKALSISFRSGLLILEISEMQSGFKYEPIIAVHLSPVKASILSTEIVKYKEYKSKKNADPKTAFGVNAGIGEKTTYIGFHVTSNGEDAITIGQIDSAGTIIKSEDYIFRSDFHYGLEWSDITAMKTTKVMYNNLELDQVASVITDFARSMSGAIAYSVLDLGRYDQARILGKMDPIYEKLGIERLRDRSSYGGSNSFLDNAPSKNPGNSLSIDQITDDDFLS